MPATSDCDIPTLAHVTLLELTFLDKFICQQPHHPQKLKPYYCTFYPPGVIIPRIIWSIVYHPAFQNTPISPHLVRTKRSAIPI
jgi:hypothetical protein